MNAGANGGQPEMFVPRLLRLAGKPCAGVVVGLMCDGVLGDGYRCAMGTE